MRASLLLLLTVAASIGILLARAPEARPSKPPTPYVADPEASGYVEIDRVKLYYEIHGSGEPLLLLHGGLSSSEEFASSIPEFAKRYRVILFDRRGHGRSYDTPDPFSYASMAREAREFLDAIQVEAATVIGFSDGGVVGYSLASTFPGKVTALVAVGANFRVKGMRSEAITWIEERMTESGVAEDYPTVKESFERLSPAPRSFRDFVRKTREMWLRDPYLPASDLGRIGVPVLLMAGDRDDITPEHMLEIQSLIKGSQLCIVPGADHFLIERKNALFNVLVMNFLGERRPSP